MFVLDYKSRLPIYEQLYHSITRLAALGGLEKNEQLPSVRALAQELGVNPNTVQKAYHMLEHDGVIVSIPGKGSFISEDASAPVSYTHLDVYKRQMQETVEAGKMGRAFSILTLISSVTMPVGWLFSSPIAERLGVHLWFFIAGIAVMAITAIL